MSDKDSFEAEGAFEKGMYVEVLRDNPPMKRYVSRGDIPDSIDIPGPHAEADEAVFRAIRFTRQDKTSRLQPILGTAGMGKTHMFWVLKDLENGPSHGPYLTVYVPSPPAPVRVPLHFHACVVDEGGERLFEQTADMLLTRFGELKGIIRQRYEFADVVSKAVDEYPGISSDAVKVFLKFRLDDNLRGLARRWLLGDALSQEEIEKLDVRSVLEEDDVTMATLKLLAEGSTIPIVLFIDEFEGPYNTHGELGEKQFMEVIKRLYNQCQNLVIVASCLSDVWERVYNLADSPTRSRMETPITLRPFTKKDLIEFVRQSMIAYWEENNIQVPSDILFPLTENDLDEAFSKSKGVPREAIKQVIAQLDKIIAGPKAVPQEEQADYVIKLTSAIVIGAVAKALLIAGTALGVEVQLETATGGSKTQSTAVFTLSKGGTKHRLGVDVPNIKSWNRSGGVAAYYSAIRLKQMLEKGEVGLAVIAVPVDTKGAKFESTSAELGTKLVTLRLNEDTATSLVDNTHKVLLDVEQKAFYSELITRAFA
ncbi:MAG: hypothetical protein C4K49_10150 [Candidatus Thorarchaeota archaeon]|nr:MAG: hypothetical protein C4K49_10150 [Candidatus Thorarchaeota archaeon]